MLLLAGAVLWLSSGRANGNPDPGGRTLRTLQTVTAALPPGASVILRQSNEPQRTSCDGRQGSEGWSSVSVSIEFRTRESTRQLLANAGRFLQAAGRTDRLRLDSPLGPGVRWSRAVPGVGTAAVTLAPGTRGGAPFWNLDAVAPPRGRQASGC